MKKYIGLIFSAVLLTALAVGCSGSFGFDEKGNVSLGTETGGGSTGDGGGMGSGGSSDYDPFKGTTWENSMNGYMLAFDGNTCEITKTRQRPASIARAATSISVITGTYSYTCTAGYVSFTATLKNSSGEVYATFTITASSATKGTLAIGNITYTFEKKSGGTTGGDEPGADDANRFEIKDGVLVRYKRVGAETTVIIPDTVKSIGSGVFNACDYLTSVTIPLSVESIGKGAFSGCSRLHSVSYKGSNDDWLYVLRYYNGDQGEATGLENKMIDCTGFDNGSHDCIWKKYKEFAGIAVNTVGMEIETYRGTRKDVKIPIGATSINKEAFKGQSDLTSVIIPDSVTKIGDRAFSGCSTLTSLTIPDSVTSIGKAVFENCSGLTSIAIPDGVTSINEDMFSGCSGLESVTIPNSVKIINGRAFSKCSNLVNIVIPNGVTSIGTFAFEECSNLKSVTIPISMKSIDSYTFYKCTNLESIAISNSVETIGSGAFRDCSNLTDVTIPVSVTEIESGAFGDCEKLTTVKYGGTQAQWKNITKKTYYGLSSKTIVCTNGNLTAE
ncbi:MAG: leucine-rich repeat domain-containing protein [Treponemataceae bacterium]|nr:leucine-rich repeat domain-containing protein [Treponemataceae bacterium]